MIEVRRPVMILRQAQNTGHGQHKCPKITYASVLLPPLFRKGFSKSIGTGNMVVELFLRGNFP